MNINKRKSPALKFLEGLTGGPLTLGKLIEAIRQGEEMNQPEFAKLLKISKYPSFSFSLPICLTLSFSVNAKQFQAIQ